METIRRKIKIFWLEHSDPIIFFGGIIIGVIIITQILNRLAIEKKENEVNSNNVNENTVTQTYIYSTEDKKTIQNFINYCKENKTEEAYELLSYNCKNELYQTYETFIREYYNKLFTESIMPEIRYDEEKQIFKITFYSDIIETGGFTNSTTDYYKIEQNIPENKIYINYYKNVK